MTDTIHEMTSQTSVGVHLLWAYKHPDLAQKAIDRLFETWGNAATYTWARNSSYEFSLIATRVPVDQRTSMVDVIQSKADMTQALAVAIVEFSEQQRQQPNSDWIWARHDREREAALSGVSA